MCVGVWSVEHPKYSLILGANRDEYLSRPTASADFHSFEQDSSINGVQGDILSGRDLQAGGTWLGVNKNSGRLVFLTNITEPYASYSLSRGHLVSSFLLHPNQSSENVQQVIDALISSDPKFAGFNLLLFTLSRSQRLSYDATLITNGGGGNSITSRPISSDERYCGALSNGIDGKGGNEWPKVKDSVAGLSKILKHGNEQDEMELADSIFGLLSKRTSSSPPKIRSELRETIHVGPFAVPLGPAAANKDAVENNVEQGGSVDVYGTRLSTVVLVGRDGEVVFIERVIWTLDSDGITPIRADPSTQRIHRFKLGVSS